jgi:hypothetical protein
VGWKIVICADARNFRFWSSDLRGRAGLAVTGPGEARHYALMMGSVCFIVAVWRRRISLMEAVGKWLDSRPKRRAFGPAQSSSPVNVGEPDPVVGQARRAGAFETHA